MKTKTVEKQRIKRKAKRAYLKQNPKWLKGMDEGLNKETEDTKDEPKSGQE